MAHGITKKDSMFSVNQVPWHGLGVVLGKRPKSVKDALKKAGLAWQVDQQPVFRKIGGKYVQIEGFQANYRHDTKDILGIVSDDYRVVQNQQGFEFLASLIGSELHFETAGSLWGGKWVWVLAAIPEWVEVGGDQVARYVFVSLRHDGTGGVRSQPTGVRVVCNNTIRLAESDASQAYTVKHLGDVSNQLAEARKVMQVSINYYKQFARFGNRLASQKMSERQLKVVINELYPTGVGLGLGDRAIKNREKARAQITELFLHGKTRGNAPGSKWCGYNAIVEHFEHVRPQRTAQGTFLRHFDDPNGFKARALDLVVAT
jgi:phage/plasmid-like protein (TIGR03299 family)